MDFQCICRFSYEFSLCSARNYNEHIGFPKLFLWIFIDLFVRIFNEHVGFPLDFP